MSYGIVNDATIWEGELGHGGFRLGVTYPLRAFALIGVESDLVVLLLHLHIFFNMNDNT